MAKLPCGIEKESCDPCPDYMGCRYRLEALNPAEKEKEASERGCDGNCTCKDNETTVLILQAPDERPENESEGKKAYRVVYFIDVDVSGGKVAACEEGMTQIMDSIVNGHEITFKTIDSKGVIECVSLVPETHRVG
ncbi:hypothetical protein LCGC14_2848910 [marine sediment metagenome]|uniref:Uncharacterized protein n=1 Tax=marine sediment metagenome TaxID=412755 RepID=A0A0F9AHC6_9ZZZZ